MPKTFTRAEVNYRPSAFDADEYCGTCANFTVGSNAFTCSVLGGERVVARGVCDKFKAPQTEVLAEEKDSDS